MVTSRDLETGFSLAPSKVVVEEASAQRNERGRRRPKIVVSKKKSLRV